MAYKQRILQSWTKERPNLAKWPFFYNLDHPVGPSCPNQAVDVMLVQALLKPWALSVFSDGSPKVLGLEAFKATGTFDNRLLSWILMFQMWVSGEDTSLMTGRIEPIRVDGSSFANGKHNLVRLNSFLAHLYTGAQAHGVGQAPLPNLENHFQSVFLKLADAPGTPAVLGNAIRNPR